MAVKTPDLPREAVKASEADKHSLFRLEGDGALKEHRARGRSPPSRPRRGGFVGAAEKAGCAPAGMEQPPEPRVSVPTYLRTCLRPPSSATAIPEPKCCLHLAPPARNAATYRGTSIPDTPAVSRKTSKKEPQSGHLISFPNSSRARGLSDIKGSRQERRAINRG